MSAGDEQSLDPVVREALLERIDPESGILSLERFIECALYHPEAGYYSRAGTRVGHREEADFYTAASLGPVFSRLVLASLEQRAGAPLDQFSFVEFGPESPRGIIGGLDHSPFREALTIRPGDPVDLPDRCIVFSNELFDAQPFRRFVRQSGQWLERALKLQDDQLAWCETDPGPDVPELPDAPDGYLVDWPSGARRMLQTICSQPWEGLFVAFDYGLEQATIFSERPRGTARTYSQHQMGDNILANPGHTDITCHVVWDDLEAVLRQNGFRDLQLRRQESFFVHHGASVVREILESTTGGFSPEKQTLMELLHPDNMGHKFQVLSALRGEF